MVRRFWQTYTILSALSIIVSVTACAILRLAGVPLAVARPVPAALAFTTGFPSLWDFTVPAGGGPWLLWLIFLVIRTWLTGGMYGALARVYAGLEGGLVPFTHDALRAFGRLLLWQVLWDAVWLGSALWIGDARIAGLVWCVRWMFLYANPALVCELQDSARQALGRAWRAWLQDWPAAMLLAAGLSASAAFGAWLAGARTGHAGPALWMLAATLFYAPLNIWILHMAAARYVHVSGWLDGIKRTGTVSPQSSR
jgi:hypothetical protein